MQRVTGGTEHWPHGFITHRHVVVLVVVAVLVVVVVVDVVVVVVVTTSIDEDPWPVPRTPAERHPSRLLPFKLMFVTVDFRVILFGLNELDNPCPVKLISTHPRSTPSRLSSSRVCSIGLVQRMPAP